jgi:NAD(P)H-binding
MNIVIFGANGQTGRLLTQRVLDDGHHVAAVTRRPDEFPFTHPRLSVCGADVREPVSLRDVVTGADAVLSSLGVGFTRRRVDTYSVGTANIAAAMHATGARRLVVVSSSSAYPTGGPRNASLAVRLIYPILAHTIAKTVYADICRMETVVRHSDPGRRPDRCRPHHDHLHRRAHTHVLAGDSQRGRQESRIAGASHPAHLTAAPVSGCAGGLGARPARLSGSLTGAFAMIGTGLWGSERRATTRGLERGRAGMLLSTRLNQSTMIPPVKLATVPVIAAA